MPAPLLAHAQTSRMALTNQDSVQAAPPFKSSCLGAQRSLSKLSLVPALSSLPPIFLNQRAPNKDVTREGILVFGGVHSCWSGCAPQLVLETPGRRGTLTTTLGDPEKEAPSNVLKAREKKLKSDTRTQRAVNFRTLNTWSGE